MIRSIVLSLALLSFTAHGGDGEKTPSKKLGLTLPKFGAIPTGHEIEKPKAKTDLLTPSTTSVDARYEVVKVTHGKSFMHSPNGATPVGGSLESIALTGNPPSTEKFSSVIRVKCPQKMNAPIEVVVLDPRGDTFMSAQGELNFRAAKQELVDWTVDWESTPARAPGNFQVLIRIGGQVMGTWPLKVEAAAK